jgi:hypothetical protein
MRCNVCRSNKGFCQVPKVFILDKKLSDMVLLAWESNNIDEKCMFFKKGKYRKTHEV